MSSDQFERFLELRADLSGYIYHLNRGYYRTWHGLVTAALRRVGPFDRPKVELEQRLKGIPAPDEDGLPIDARAAVRRAHTQVEFVEQELWAGRVDDSALDKLEEDVRAVEQFVWL